MDIAELSDIHLEQYRNGDTAVNFIKYLRPTITHDVLILSGDIFSLNSTNKFRYLDEFRKWAVEIIYVPGNHEYYNTNPLIEGQKELDKLQTEGIRVLGPNNHRSYMIDGIKFVGTTAWYPDNATVRYRVQNWADKGYIKNFISWWSAHQVEERKLLWEEVEENSIVITHMLPSFKCISPTYFGDPYNCLYVSDLEDLLLEKNPAFWFSGHSHESSDLIIGNTRCIRNPIGYVAEISNNITSVLSITI